VAGDDARLLVVAGGVASELEYLGREVFEDGGEVDRGAGADTLGVVALFEDPERRRSEGEERSSADHVPVDAANGELRARQRAVEGASEA
jgi:hypothetical protein